MYLQGTKTVPSPSKSNQSINKHVNVQASNTGVSNLSHTFDNYLVLVSYTYNVHTLSTF